MSITGMIKKLFSEPAPAPVTKHAEPATRQWISNPWHAVSIAPCRQACAAAQCAVGMRYLSNEAPTLPLTGCDANACLCRYKHHEDRRHDVRRAADVWSSRRSWGGRERRGQHGRRASDQA